MHTFHRLNSTITGVPVNDSRGLRDLTRTTLVHDHSQQMTTAFTPDSLEEEEYPMKPHNHTSGNRYVPSFPPLNFIEKLETT